MDAIFSLTFHITTFVATTASTVYGHEHTVILTIMAMSTQTELMINF